MFRFHDHWHRMKPDGISAGMTRELLWEKNAVSEGFEEFCSQLARWEPMPQGARFVRKGKPDPCGFFFKWEQLLFRFNPFRTRFLGSTGRSRSRLHVLFAGKVISGSNSPILSSGATSVQSAMVEQ